MGIDFARARPEDQTKNTFKSALTRFSKLSRALQDQLHLSPTRRLIHYMLLAKGTLHLPYNDYRDNATRAT